MNRELIAVIEQLGREKGIGSEKIIKAVEMAVLTAAKKRPGAGAEENIQVRVDPRTGEIEAVLLKRIVEQVADPQQEISLAEARKVDETAEVGDEIGAMLEVADLGRIAAQTAKQVIFQRVREAEWEAVYRDYTGREGTLATGVVLGQERRNYIVELGKAEAILPYSEQAPREIYRRGDRIKAILIEVKPSSRGPQLVLSRTHPDFIPKLFRHEVPEIAEGVVEIKGVVREPGDRTKIAVKSNNPAVDPVGACVGMKGSRVQGVVRELRGEKIDIIAWRDDPRFFIAEAMSPASILKVGITAADKSATVVVADAQLSLAIGKKGQNVRLASKLTGWKIDIHGEGQYEQTRLKEREKAMAEIQAAAQTAEPQVPQAPGIVPPTAAAAMDASETAPSAAPAAEPPAPSIASAPAASSVTALPGVGGKMAEVFRAHGLETVEQLAQATKEQLLEIPGIGEKRAEKLLAAALARMAALKTGSPPAPNETDQAAQTDQSDQPDEAPA